MEIGHDKTDTWEKFGCMSFDFRYDPFGLAPTGCLVLETVILNIWLLGWTTNGTGQQMVNMLVEYIIAL